MEFAIAPETLERSRPDGAPAPQSSGQNPAALVAGALLAAGFASLVIFQQPSAQSAPEASLPPSPSPQRHSRTDASVLVPFTPEATLAPQYEDGLVPFSLLAPVVTERPLTETVVLQQPILRFEAPAQAHPGLPLVERGRARPSLARMTRFSGAFRVPNLSSREAVDARTARGAALWAAARAAAAAVFGVARPAQAVAIPDPARDLFHSVVTLNGGYNYTQEDTNDFAHGYKVCSRQGFRCKPQPNGMVIHTPEGATISHTYARSRNPRNAIFVTLPGVAAAQEVSHCPLVFDLGGRGVRTSDQAIRYDVDGRGRVALVHDVASDTGVLAFDGDRNGIAGATGRELFGDGTDLDGDGLPDGHLDGFDALDSFVRRAEKAGAVLAGTADSGLLSSVDLAKLHKRYGLSLRLGSLGGRAVSPAEAGVAQIHLSAARSIRVENFDAQLNDVVRRQGATFTRADGSTGAYEDVFFKYERPNLKAAVALAK